MRHIVWFLLVTVAKCDLECDLSSELKAEIASYQPIVDKIIEYTTLGDFKGTTYTELATFVDTFGPRFTGTQNLENSIDYMLNISQFYGLENVHGEEVEVPIWQRGEESATLIQPRQKKIPMLGLIHSIGTPAEGIIADVLVVKSFEELTEKAELAEGKIVVYNEEFVSYGETGRYRGFGAVEAARVGAVATLIRSVTPFSPANPHTGILRYEDGVPEIPAACITASDANMLQRMQERGQEIKIHLKMEAKHLANGFSRNAIAEIPGHADPDNIVIVSGHVDTVDVAEGAMDNGGGVFISWAAAVLLKNLGLTARRTIRAIYWTAEEVGGVGLYAYQEEHKDDNFNFIMDSDVGTFTPIGIQYFAGSDSRCVLEEIMKLLAPINATQAEFVEGLSYWPGYAMASLHNLNDRYFWFHHSIADTMDVENSEDLDKCAVVWATVAYVVADLSIDIIGN